MEDLANKLLNSLNNEEIELYLANDKEEPHIVISDDRFISVPPELQRIAVQFDHNIETVTFDCPRFWDGHDMSKMHVYINYMRKDRARGMYIADNVRVDETDENIMHFEWTISRNATLVKGVLTFLVCVKKTVYDKFDEDGNGIEGIEVNHWNSEINTEMFVSEGLEVCDNVVEEYPDVITQLLTRMDIVEIIASPGMIDKYVSESLTDNKVFLEGIEKVVTPEAIQNSVNNYMDTNPNIVIIDGMLVADEWVHDENLGYFVQHFRSTIIKSTDRPILYLQLTGDDDADLEVKRYWNLINSADTVDEAIVFKTKVKPTVDISFIAKISFESEIDLEVEGIPDATLDELLVL